MVLLWADGRQGLLLAGDLQEQGVVQLLHAGVPGPVQLLKLPHHGSRYSLFEKLVAQLNPDCCLVSAGFRNSYHLPAQEVVDFLADKEVLLYRTDLQGT